MQSYLFDPAQPVKAKDGKLFVSGPRVVTPVQGKEHIVHYRTKHSNPEIQTLYEEFKLAKSKLAWLVDNKERCQKFNINVSGIIEKLTN